MRWTPVLSTLGIAQFNITCYMIRYSNWRHPQWRRRGMETHDDVIKWKHFPRNWPFVRGIHRSRWIPTQRPVTRSFDVFFDLRLNKRLSKQPWGWWFETPSRSLWRQCNGFSHYWPAMRRLQRPSSIVRRKWPWNIHYCQWFICHINILTKRNDPFV